MPPQVESHHSPSAIAQLLSKIFPGRTIFAIAMEQQNGRHRSRYTTGHVKGSLQVDEVKTLNVTPGFGGLSALASITATSSWKLRTLSSRFKNELTNFFSEDLPLKSAYSS